MEGIEPTTTAPAAEPAPVEADVFTLSVEETDVLVRDAAKREIDVRIVPWGVSIDTLAGREQFAPGAFDHVNAADVLLMGMEHEIGLGIGQDGRPVPIRHPMGRALSLANLPDGQHATFRVARTAAGDDFLALAADGIVRGVSAEFRTVPGGTDRVRIDGRMTNVHRRADLTAVSPTYRPAYREAGVLAVRSEPEEEITPVSEPVIEPVAQASAFDPATVLAPVNGMFERVMERLGKLEDQARSEFRVPVPESAEEKAHLGEWAKVALSILSGDRIAEQQFRAVADIINTDNAGILPPTYLTEIIGVISNARPFLSSTRQIPTPASGLQLVVPKITQRPTTAVQATEKTELSSQATKITTVSYNAKSIGGVGDIALQMLKRSDPSFLDLYIRLLAEAYAATCEDEAMDALVAAVGGYHERTALDPDNLSLGSAFTTSYDAMKRPPDTIWLSTDAVAAFINAKATTTNQPLYSSLRTEATAAGGIQGQISGLNAVHVPALDAHGYFAIVGPSAGFAWAEDGAYTLQVDVPSKAGRDVAMVGMLWLCPFYADAFSLYKIGS